MRVVAGTTPTFRGHFVNPQGEGVEIEVSPVVTFHRDGQEIWQTVERIIVNEGNGQWSATLTIPPATVPGWITLRWFVGSEPPVAGEEIFEIVLSTTAISESDLERNLRRRLRDVLTDPHDDSGAFFSNDEIHTMLAIHGGNLNGAALEGWLIKMAFFSKFVDVDESGSSRRLSQMFKNAEAMANFYQKAVRVEMEASAAHMKQGIKGKVASLRGEYHDTFGLAFLARNGIPSTHVYFRPFPTKRLITGV